MVGVPGANDHYTTHEAWSWLHALHGDVISGELYFTGGSCLAFWRSHKQTAVT